MLKKIVSFGYKFGGPQPTAGVSSIAVDVRRLFSNPFTVERLRSKNGLSPEVADFVRQSRSFDVKYQHLKEQIQAPGLEEVWIGCHGGQHRSVFLAEQLANELGIGTVEHRDLLVF